MIYQYDKPLRNTVLLFLFFLVTSNVFSQSASFDAADALDEPTINIIPVEPGQTVFDFLSIKSRYSQFDIDPGKAPEGDYLGWVTFTRDGERVLLTNRITDNVTVFDWSTMTVLSNIDVGGYPSDIAVSDSYAVVACALSDEVYIIDLNSLLVDTIFTLPAGQQPWIVRISPDGSTAFVSCDISNTCEVFNLVTKQHVLTISNFPVALTSWGIISENARNSFTFSNFKVSPGGNYLIVGDWVDKILFFNTATGAVDYVIDDILKCPIVGLSGDGSKVIAVSLTNPAVLYQIDISSHTVTGSVTLTGYQISILALEVGVNWDGSKAFVGITDNKSAIVRFATSDFKVLSSTYTPFWIGTSPDHSLAISGQNRFSVVDFATEAVIGQHVGNSQYYGATSPYGSLAVGFNPYVYEGIYFYDYSMPSIPICRGSISSGLDPEGDAPRRVAITPDGSKAIVTNVLSDNATIVDLNTYCIDTIIPIGDRVKDVAITSDSRWAVICGCNSNSVKVIDIDSLKMVAEVPTGERAGVVSITPDDEYAYIGNIRANTVSVVELSGASSHKITDIPCGTIGTVWVAYGVSSAVEMSPSGDYVLVAVSLDDQVKVIDTETNSIVSSLEVGDCPIQIAFNDSGNYAAVTNYADGTYTMLHIDGAQSSVVNSFWSGTKPLRLFYNYASDEIGIGYYSDKKIVNVIPETGEIVSTCDYSDYGNLIQVRFDELGEALVLTMSDSTAPGYLHRGDEAIALPSIPSHFDYCSAVRKAAVVMPGPDFLCVIEWDTLGVKEVVTIPFPSYSILHSPKPNPFQNKTDITFSVGQMAESTELKIYDVSGRVVKDFNLTSPASLREAGRACLLLPVSVVSWDGTDDLGKKVPAGVYFVKLESEGHTQTRKIVLLR